MRAILGLLATGMLMTATSVVLAESPVGEDPGTGALLARMNGLLVPMPVVAMDVSLSISGPIVRGRVVQTFTNPTAATLEAEYVFPLPEGAAVDGLMLEVGDRRFVGEIHEKEEARRTYEKAKAKGKAPASSSRTGRHLPHARGQHSAACVDRRPARDHRRRARDGCDHLVVASRPDDRARVVFRCEGGRRPCHRRS